MGKLAPGDIFRYQKGSDTNRFVTLEERTKEAYWGDTYKIRILGQNESLETVEDPLTTTKSPSQIPTNLEEVGDKDTVEANITREDMAELWSINDPL